MLTQAEIFHELVNLLSDFQGQTCEPDEIGESTMFFQDLGFASIDAVVLGETLEQQFDTKLPFNRFLSSLAEKGAQDVSVGDLAKFLYESLAAGG